ncbi:MAG: P-II family nitrogen regulator [Spirochaetales bacterium]|jgi:nitrogen regulatory protein PII 1|nr:P-II family nitrogen regulator [Spirochaetales bacterium]
MIMVKSVVRPEKVQDVMDALLEAGYPAVTKVSVVGRGQQKGIKVGEVVYDELPKEMLINVIKKTDKDLVLKIIMKAAKTGEEGSYGDGKIFISPVEEAYTVRTGDAGL